MRGHQPLQAAGRGRDHRLGDSARRARRAASSTRRSSTRTLGTVLKYREDQERVRQQARRRRHASSRPSSGRVPASAMTSARRATVARRDCEIAVAFARVLRGAGLNVPIGQRASTSPRRSACVGIDERDAVYWAGACDAGCAGPRTSPCSTARSPCSGSSVARATTIEDDEALRDHARDRRQDDDDGDADERRRRRRSDDRAALLHRRGAARQGLRRSTTTTNCTLAQRPDGAAALRRPATAVVPARARRVARPTPDLRAHGARVAPLRRRTDPAPVARAGRPAAPTRAAARRQRLDGAVRASDAALRARRGRRPPAGRGVRPRNAPHPDHARTERAAIRTRAAPRQPSASSTGAAARGSASACARSTTSGVCAAWPATRSSSSSPTAGTVAIPRCSPSRCSDCIGSRYRTGLGEPAEGHARVRTAGAGDGRGAAVRRRSSSRAIPWPRWRSSPQVISSTRPLGSTATRAPSEEERPMSELLDDIDRWRGAGKRVAVARVVDIEGSGPARARCGDGGERGRRGGRQRQRRVRRGRGGRRSARDPRRRRAARAS